MRRLTSLLALASLAAACRTGRGYSDADVPRHAGMAPASAAPRAGDTLRIVSFNIEFALRVDAAIALLAGDPALRDADVVLLQEMDADATRRVAEALRMGWVYYPALRHRRTGRDFGNAVLSRWPIVDDARLVLPHPSWYAGTHRIATAATVQVGATRLRVYSTHLGTPLDVTEWGRREQLRAIVAAAAPYPHVVIGGDLNSRRVGAVARDAGFAWPTERLGRTTRLGRWDHLFVRGLTLPARDAAGVVPRARGISDHHPVWGRVVMP
ncbi:MAG TPA: endonuclease/exonuclease/phosphatase family protein [Gemmatimonadaceae bacterium]|nr:endonuclease/exonuclease/phosphatase family protein [Gemmatimonadaceae bacterium]